MCDVLRLSSQEQRVGCHALLWHACVLVMHRQSLSKRTLHCWCSSCRCVQTKWCCSVVMLIARILMINIAASRTYVLCDWIAGKDYITCFPHNAELLRGMRRTSAAGPCSTPPWRCDTFIHVIKVVFKGPIRPFWDVEGRWNGSFMQNRAIG